MDKEIFGGVRSIVGVSLYTVVRGPLERNYD